MKTPVVVVVRPDPEDGGFVSEVVGRPGCMSQGETVGEALANVGEAYEAILEARASRDERLLADIAAADGSPRAMLEKAIEVLEGPEPDVVAALELIGSALG